MRQRFKDVSIRYKILILTGTIELAMLILLARGRIVTFSVGSGLFVLNIFILWVALEWFTSPLKEVSLMVKKAANMDFDVSVDVKSGDEIGTLAEAFNCLMENLRHTLNKLDNYQDQIWHSERLAVIGEYSTCIMHEIKNMLTGIHCAMELINKENTKDKFVLKVCNEVQTGIRGFNERIMCLPNPAIAGFGFYY